MWAQVNELLFRNFLHYSVSAGLWRPSTEYYRVADTRPNRVTEPSIGSALLKTFLAVLESGDPQHSSLEEVNINVQYEWMSELCTFLPCSFDATWSSLWRWYGGGDVVWGERRRNTMVAYPASMDLSVPACKHTYLSIILTRKPASHNSQLHAHLQEWQRLCTLLFLTI